MSIGYKNNVRISGGGQTPIIFAHGLGCDQNVWARLAAEFAGDHQIVLFDHVGAGKSDLAAYQHSRYGSLHGYAYDLLDICEHYDLQRPILVGHSVGAIIGMLAAIASPHSFQSVLMVAPSPCYINDGDYVGGFTKPDIEDLLDLMDSNYLGWTSTMAKLLMQHADEQSVEDELANGFCRTDPDIARHFASVTFLSDHRADLARMPVPSLILQPAQDIVAPLSVGHYMHAQMKNSQLVKMDAIGHCPHLSAVAETTQAIRHFMATGTPAGI